MKGPNEEKLSDGGIVVNNRFLKWLDNFWYHNKWIVLISAAFLFTFIVCFVQCSGRETSDISVVFAGTVVTEYEDEGGGEAQIRYTALRGEAAEKIRAIFGTLSPENDDGERATVAFPTYTVYSEAELLHNYGGESGEGYVGARYRNQENIDLLATYIQTGESSVWFLSPEVYDLQNFDTLAVPLAETFGEKIPDGAVDAYAVRLGDTDLYRYYDAMQVLPADTLIVLTKSYAFGKSSDDEVYRASVALYRAILEFRTP